jgi:hypothetical protein
MMVQMSPIFVVPLPLVVLQAVPKVVILRDRMNMIIDHLKWNQKLMCVHSCYSIYRANEVDDNVIYYYLYDDITEVLI